MQETAGIQKKYKVNLEDGEELEDIRKEFRGITHQEAYKRAFNDRVMLQLPEDPTRFLGNDQRENFIPHLKELLMKIPQTNACIWDVGAGAGEILDTCLGISKLDRVTLHLEEPNLLLIDRYKARIKNYPRFQLGQTWTEPIENCEINWNEIGRVHLVLAMHMIYHLSDFRSPKIDPIADILKVSFKTSTSL
jgi:hypothetical protein